MHTPLGKRTDEFDYIRLKDFFQQNLPWKTINKQPTKQENIFGTSKSDKRLLCKISKKNDVTSMSKGQILQKTKQAKYMNRQGTEEHLKKATST